MNTLKITGHIGVCFKIIYLTHSLKGISVILGKTKNFSNSLWNDKREDIQYFKTWVVICTVHNIKSKKKKQRKKNTLKFIDTLS